MVLEEGMEKVEIMERKNSDQHFNQISREHQKIQVWKISCLGGFSGEQLNPAPQNCNKLKEGGANAGYPIPAPCNQFLYKILHADYTKFLNPEQL